MFTISKGFAVISATKNLHLPFIKDIFASGRTRFLEWVVSENQLLYLDSVFHDDILSVFGTGWTFSSFSVVSLLDANLIQPNAVNYGIFFIRHMQYYRQLWYDQYNSNVQRMRLAIELLRNEKKSIA